MKYKNLIGKKVQIIAKRKACEFLTKLNFESYSFEATLQEVNKDYIVIKKQSGMIGYFPIEDKYVAIEKIILV